MTITRTAAPRVHKQKCAECNTPVFEVNNGVLIVRSTHFGKKHLTVLTRERLDELLTQR